MDTIKEELLEPNSKKNTKVRLRDVKKNQVVSSNEMTSAEVAVVQGNKERQAGRMVHKKFSKDGAAEEFVSNYLLLKEKGFPVPATVRKVAGKNEVLITDLTEGGKKTVYSLNELFVMPPQSEVLRNIEAVKFQLSDISERADMLEIYLPQDVYFLVQDEEKNGEIILGDLEGVSVISKTQNPMTFRHRITDLTRYNADNFSQRITSIFVSK